jgi:DNA-binding transcriptional MocR family regulator
MTLIRSDRIQRIKPSPSTAARAKVVALEAGGAKIIDLTIGEPDYDTPDHIRQPGVDAIWAGQTKYTPVAGTAALRKAVADKFRRENGIEFTPSQIFVGSGAKQVIYNALACTLTRPPPPRCTTEAATCAGRASEYVGTVVRQPALMLRPKVAQNSHSHRTSPRQC